MAEIQNPTVRFEIASGELLHTGALTVDQQPIGLQQQFLEVQTSAMENPSPTDKSPESQLFSDHKLLWSVVALGAVVFAMAANKSRRGEKAVNEFNANNVDDKSSRSAILRLGDFEHDISDDNTAMLDRELYPGEPKGLWGSIPLRSLPEPEQYLNARYQIVHYNVSAGSSSKLSGAKSRVIARSVRYWGGIQNRYDAAKPLSDKVLAANAAVESAKRASDDAGRASEDFVYTVNCSVDDTSNGYSFCRGSEVIDTAYKSAVLSAVAVLPQVLTRQMKTDLPFESGAYQIRAGEFSEVLADISKIQLSDLMGAREYVNTKLSSLKYIMDYMEQYPDDLAAKSFVANNIDTKDKLEVIAEMLNKSLDVKPTHPGVNLDDDVRHGNAKTLLNQAIIISAMRPEVENSLAVNSWLKRELLADFVGSIQIPKTATGGFTLEHIIKNKETPNVFKEVMSIPPRTAELLDGEIQYGNTTPTKAQIAYMTMVAAKVKYRKDRYFRNFAGSDRGPAEVLRFNLEMQHCMRAYISIELAVILAINRPDELLSDETIISLGFKPDSGKTKIVATMIYARHALHTTDEAERATLSDTVKLVVS